MHACDDLDERRFSGAVFSKQCVNFAGADIKANIVEHADANERLGDVR